MLKRKMETTNEFFSDDTAFCENSKKLILSKSFYLLLERFCNTMAREDTEYDYFLNKYFNDEGYVDIWRIPLMILDCYNGNLHYYNKLLCDEAFRKKLIKLMGDFYNYCITRQGLLNISGKFLENYHKNSCFLRKSQCLYNLLVDTYSRVLENIHSYEKEEKEVG